MFYSFSFFARSLACLFQMQRYALFSNRARKSGYFFVCPLSGALKNELRFVGQLT